MVIRKLFKIECSHVVRGCTTKKCSQNYHGHSAKIEVFLKAERLDDAGMVMDFGRLKPIIGQFTDMFDHSIHLFTRDNKECIEFFKKYNNRYILLPFNPTAENYALFFRNAINELLQRMNPINGESGVYCSGVRYYETDTGYAQSEESDYFDYGISDISVSPGCMEGLKELEDFYNSEYNLWKVERK